MWGEKSSNGTPILPCPFTGTTTDLQVLEYWLPMPWPQLRFIRVDNSQGPSWVAWPEIEVYSPWPANGAWHDVPL